MSDLVAFVPSIVEIAGVPMMGSKAITELLNSVRKAGEVEVTHKNILRDIRNMLESFDGSDLSNQFSLVKDSRGYVCEIFLGEDLSLCFVAGKDVRVRFNISKSFNQRKKEEAAKACALPNFQNPAEAAEAWAAEFRAKQLAEARLVELAPKAAFYDKYLESDGLLSMNNAAKILGIGRNTLFNELREAKVFTGTAPRQTYIDSGYFTVKVSVNDTWTGPVAKVTPKGIEWLSKGTWKRGAR
jgi:phage antirepressor YoqD-like protein